MIPRPDAPPVPSRITAEEPCLPPHTTEEVRRLRRNLLRVHGWAFLFLAAGAGALLASLLGPVR